MTKTHFSAIDLCGFWGNWDPLAHLIGSGNRTGKTHFLAIDLCKNGGNWGPLVHWIGSSEYTVFFLHFLAKEPGEGRRRVSKVVFAWENVKCRLCWGKMSNVVFAWAWRGGGFKSRLCWSMKGGGVSIFFGLRIFLQGGERKVFSWPRKGEGAEREKENKGWKKKKNVYL